MNLYRYYNKFNNKFIYIYIYICFSKQIRCCLLLILSDNYRGLVKVYAMSFNRDILLFLNGLVYIIRST